MEGDGGSAAGTVGHTQKCSIAAGISRAARWGFDLEQYLLLTLATLVRVARRRDSTRNRTATTTTTTAAANDDENRNDKII